MTSSPATESALLDAMRRIHEIARADNKHDYDVLTKADFADSMDAIFQIALESLRRPPVSSPVGESGNMNNGLPAGAGPNPQATQNSPATNIAKELRREAAQWHPSEKSPIRQLLAGADEIERLTAAIERLGSSETLTIPFAFGRSAADDELKARIEYARDALAGKTAAQQSEGEAKPSSSIRSEALEEK